MKIHVSFTGKREGPMRAISVLAIDLAKAVFQLHGVNEFGKPVFKKQVKRAQLLREVLNIPPCTVAMESCATGHYWARKFRAMGHEVKLIAPQHVKPFIKSQKNDANDAEGIAIAAQQESMRFVPIKEVWQQELQTLHRARELAVASKVAYSNSIIGLLGEYGFAIAKGLGVKRLIEKTIEIFELENENVSLRLREILIPHLDQLRNLKSQVEVYDKMIEAIAEEREDCRRIMKIRGVGAKTATAIVGSTSPHVFKNGRQFAASLGLVPRQNSSGGRTNLYGITKRGDKYLRSLLVHGARSTVYYAGRHEDQRSKWIVEKQKTRGTNKTVVAVANRNARVIWALITKKEEYKVA